MTHAKTPVPVAGIEAERQIGRMTRRSFTVGGMAAAAGFGGLAWLGTRTRTAACRSATAPRVGIQRTPRFRLL